VDNLVKGQALRALIMYLHNLKGYCILVVLDMACFLWVFRRK